MSLNGIIDTKYASMTNHQYLDPLFDFYSAGIRLQAHERTKIARSMVMVAYERDIK